MITLMIVGAAGRMGREVVRAAAAGSDFKIAAAIEEGRHPDIGKDAGKIAGLEEAGVKISDDTAGNLKSVDAIIDFSLPESTAKLFEALPARPKPAVVGTTGLDDKTMALVKEVSRKAPLLVAPNLSYGIAVLKYLTRSAMRFLDGFDTEVMEIHHRNKVDAPSGTAGALLDVIREGAGQKRPGVAVLGREGKNSKRKPGETGVHALRGGSVTGEHTVFFFGDGERIEIKHIAENRKIFALGALNAVKWLVEQSAGLYAMEDIFK